MEKIQIARLSIKDTNKAGVKYLTKMGKPFEMMSLLIKGGKYDGKWASSCLFDKTNSAYTWKEGDSVTVVLEQNGEFLNFKAPSQLDMLETRVTALEQATGLSKTAKLAEEVFTQPIVDRIDPADLPF